MEIDILTEDILDLKDSAIELSDIIIYNDDVNTFEFVIESIMEICGHDLVQAEQCTWLIHYKGKCGVKRGTFEKLKPLCVAFLDKGLSAKIE